MVTRIRPRRALLPFRILLFVIAVIIIAHICIDRFYAYRLHEALGYPSIYAKNMWFEIFSRYLGAAVYLVLSLWAVRPFASILPRAAFRGVQVLFAVIGWIIGYAMWSLDATSWLLFFHHQPFYQKDAMFNIDVSFYVYVLPLLLGILARIAGTIVLWMAVRVVSVVAAFAQQQLKVSKPGLSGVVRNQSRALLFALAVLLLCFTGVSFLNRYEMVLTSGNQSFVFGPDFVTAHLTLPIFSWIHTGLLLIAALAVLWQALHLNEVFPERDGFVIPSWRSFRRPIYALGLYVVSLVLSGIVGSLVNALYVHPNQNTVELPFIKRTIDATRWALGIQNVKTTQFTPAENLTAAAVKADPSALDNVRVNDQGQTTQIYNQLQSFKNYFTFTNTQVDRYQGKEVYIATREMDTSKLPVPTWVNQTLVYTHGYGVAASPVNQFDANGLPVLWAQNTPQQTTAPLPTVTRPQIYFGFMSNDVIAPSKQPEFDYPVGNGQASSHYQGGYGLPVAGNRLLLTIEQANLKYFTSDQITPKSQFLFDRNIYQRVQDIAPFLSYDQDAYSFIDSAGHIEWILDAYTKSGNIPYAQHFLGTAYIRNSVKVVIDAYTGKVTFYVVDKSDPMLQSLIDVYPGVFTTTIPSDVSAHFRYPTNLFQAQAEALTRYHMTDPSSFYNQDDLWQVSQQIYDQNQKEERPPVYQMLQMPDETASKFVLSELFTPATKDNLNGWLIAGNDPSDYGQLKLYQFPQSTITFGPMQAENQIDSNPTISAQLSLWNQQGSHVVRGDMLLIPLQNTLLYVEPVYLVADRTNSLPQLERVIVDYNQQVYMDDTLGATIQDILSGQPAGGDTGTTGQGTGTGGGVGGAGTGTAGSGAGTGAGGTGAGAGGTGTGTGGAGTGAAGSGAGTGAGGTGAVGAGAAYQSMTTNQLIAAANKLFSQYETDTAQGKLDKAGQDLSNLRTVLSLLQSKAPAH